MKLEIFFFSLTFYFGGAFLFNNLKDGTNWNDLKVTWGINPFDSNNFQSLPRTEAEAKSKGWVKEKDCSKVNGNRYIINGDRAVMLIFNSLGIIAGIGSYVPKNLPFNFPSSKIQSLFVDEGDFFTISAYFVDPNSVCSPSASARQVTGDRLIVKGSTKELKIPLQQKDIEPFWTQGKCFYTMGVHFWANIDGTELNEDTPADNFAPLFLLYNQGKLNGFGWAFNADLSSKRFEHPDQSVIGRFFNKTPKFFSDPSKVGKLSTLHIYFDSTPQLNFC